MIICTLCLCYLNIFPKMSPKPSAKSFGLKPSATEAEAECQKPSASAEDLRPSVDLLVMLSLLQDRFTASHFGSFLGCSASVGP